MINSKFNFKMISVDKNVSSMLIEAFKNKEITTFLNIAENSQFCAIESEPISNTIKNCEIKT